MKRVLRREQIVREKAEYVCDFTGKKLGDSAPVHIEIWCGYPSNRDGLAYRLHLCDEALNELMAYLRYKMYPRKMRDSASCYFDGMSANEIPRRSEDLITRRKLKSAVLKQLE